MSCQTCETSNSTNEFYTKSEIHQLLRQVYDFETSLASKTRIGTSRLTDEPLDDLDPEAAGSQSPLYQSGIQKKYLKGFASFAAARAAIGATPTELVCDGEIPIPSSVALPKTLVINPQTNCFFNVAAGATLTVAAMVNVGNRHIFKGEGNVYFTKNSVEYINLYWYTGEDDTQPITKALDNICFSFFLMNGGRAHLHNGDWKTQGGHAVQSGSHFLGTSTSSYLAPNGTNITLTTNNSCIFKIGAAPALNSRNMMFENMNLSNGTTTGSRCILATGTTGESAVVGILCRNIVFNKGYRGFSIESVGGGWNLEQVAFERCQWLGGITQGIYCDSNNTSIKVDGHYFQHAAGCTGIYLLRAGMLHITGAGNTVGPPGSNPGYSPNNRPHPLYQNSTFIEIHGDHLPVLIEKTQEENVGWFLRYYGQQSYSSVTLRGNLIQSMILINGSNNIIDEGNDYRIAECFVTDQSASASTATRITSRKSTCGVFAGAFTVDGIEVRDPMLGKGQGALNATTLNISNLTALRGTPQSLQTRHINKIISFTVSGTDYTRKITAITSNTVSFTDPLPVAVPANTNISIEPLNNGCLMSGFLPLGELPDYIPNFSYFDEYDQIDRYKKVFSEAQTVFKPSSHLQDAPATLDEARVEIRAYGEKVFQEWIYQNPYTEEKLQFGAVAWDETNNLLYFKFPNGVFPTRGLRIDGILKSEGLLLGISPLLQNLFFGQASLGSAGSVTITNAAAKNNCVIIPFGFTGLAGQLSGTISNGVSFTLTSSSGATDAGKLVMWAMFCPPG